MSDRAQSDGKNWSVPPKHKRGMAPNPTLSSSVTQDRRGRLNTAKSATSTVSRLSRKPVLPLPAELEVQLAVLSQRGNDEKLWNQKLVALDELARLVSHKADLVRPHATAVQSAVVGEVRNLRSSVAQQALVTLGTLYQELGPALDQGTAATVLVLFKKAGESVGTKFVLNLIAKVLWLVGRRASPGRAASVLLASSSHRGGLIRRLVVETLRTVVPRLEPAQKSALLAPLVLLAEDSMPECRFHARTMIMEITSAAEWHPGDSELSLYFRQPDRAAARRLLADVRKKGAGTESACIYTPVSTDNELNSASRKQAPKKKRGGDTTDGGNARTLPAVHGELKLRRRGSLPSIFKATSSAFRWLSKSLGNKRDAGPSETSDSIIGAESTTASWRTSSDEIQRTNSPEKGSFGGRHTPHSLSPPLPESGKSPILGPPSSVCSPLPIPPSNGWVGSALALPGELPSLDSWISGKRGAGPSNKMDPAMKLLCEQFQSSDWQVRRAAVCSASELPEIDPKYSATHAARLLRSVFMRCTDGNGKVRLQALAAVERMLPYLTEHVDSELIAQLLEAASPSLATTKPRLAAATWAALGAAIDELKTPKQAKELIRVWCETAENANYKVRGALIHLLTTLVDLRGADCDEVLREIVTPACYKWLDEPRLSEQAACLFGAIQAHTGPLPPPGLSPPRKLKAVAIALAFGRKLGSDDYRTIGPPVPRSRVMHSAPWMTD